MWNLPLRRLAAVVGVAFAVILGACRDSITGPDQSTNARRLRGVAAAVACEGDSQLVGGGSATNAVVVCTCGGGDQLTSGGGEATTNAETGCATDCRATGWIGHPECDPYDCSIYPEGPACDGDGSAGNEGGGSSWGWYDTRSISNEETGTENNQGGSGPQSSAGYYAPDRVVRGEFVLDFTDQCGVLHTFTFQNVVFERLTHIGRRDEGQYGWKAIYAITSYTDVQSSLANDNFLMANRVPINSKLTTNAGGDRWAGAFTQSSKADARGTYYGRCYP
jgi:hypothetical protein